MDFQIMGADTETSLIGPEQIIPDIACLALHSSGESCLYSACDPECPETVEALMDPKADFHVAFHNASFDLGVFFKAYPKLWLPIFESLEAGRIHCTIIREKLLALADWGSIDFRPVFPGSSNMTKASYGLDVIAKRRLGVDLFEDKHGADSWRLRYSELADVPVAQWPQEAIRYAIGDPEHCVNIWKDQENDRAKLQGKLGMDPLASQTLRVAVDFALSLATAWGMEVRPATLIKASEEVRKARDPFRQNEDGSLHWGKLFTTDIWKSLKAETKKAVGADESRSLISFPTDPKPFANGAKEHLDTCPGHKDHPEYKKGKKIECLCPPKMAKGSDEKKSRGALQEYVQSLAVEKEEIEVWRNEPTAIMIEKGETEGNISTDKEWMETFADYDEALSQYHERAKLDKLVTSYLPKMFAEDGTPHDRIHFPFDCLKRTGRSSSRESDRFPSMNGQQMDPRIRKALRAGDLGGKPALLCSWDYKAMELCTTAQKCLDVLGYSRMAERINAGKDPHSSLGSISAARMEEGFMSDFRSILDDEEKLYDSFLALAKDRSPCPYPWAKSRERASMKDFCKHFRTFAKPANLGLPGGLGIATFRAYAKATYGVVMSDEQAIALKGIWMELYPEIPAYFKHMTTNMVDYRNGKSEKELPTGEIRKSDRYWYVTRFGMVRSAADYCAAANGSLLQSDSAEGALLSFFSAQKACHEPSGILAPDENGFVVKPCDFIHDEILAAVRDDDRAVVTKRLKEVSRIMVENFQVVTPDVKASAEPALMRRCWIKAAEPVVDEDGNYVPWDDVPENLEWAEKGGLI